MTRRDRIKRLAQLRGDKAALAILETARTSGVIRCVRCDAPAVDCIHSPRVTESELRALWGDR